MVRERLTTDYLLPRDLALLQALHDGRFITTDQASRYIWHSPGSANRRLRQLEIAAFIHRQRDRANNTTIIRPTPLASSALVARGCMSDAEASAGWTWQQLHERKVGFVAHEAATNEIRFALLAAAPAARFNLVSSCCGPRARQLLAVDGQSGCPRPDRYLALRVPTTPSRQHFFLEVDMGSKPVKRSKPRCGPAHICRKKDIVRRGPAWF